MFYFYFYYLLRFQCVCYLNIVPYKMLSSVGTFYPHFWDNCEFNATEHQYLQPNSKSTFNQFNPNNEYWKQSEQSNIIQLHPSRSFTIRSQFDQFATNWTNIHNDGNDGLVFGSPQEYCDTKQYGWVWRWTNDTYNRWVCYIFLLFIFNDQFAITLFVSIEYQLKIYVVYLHVA